ncbi:hypothetical protein M5D96_000062 [Drosophila gunungcola]|uniref:Uncharacterized protein n=1 Tax=Drosophila gunungcola TaxID=103775 RepID=A0A9P9YVL8_9MUSC|nr:hypothetical protein M5D96_000062 [Drosophila gunungcola]
MPFVCLPKVLLLLQLSDSRYFGLVTYGYDGRRSSKQRQQGKLFAPHNFCNMAMAVPGG